MKSSTTLTLALLASAFAAPAYAQKLECNKSFGFRADVNNVKGQTLCASSVDAFLDSAKHFNLSNPGYTDNSASLAQARLNDVNMVLSYAANSRVLNYSFVELGINGSFTGATRDDAEDQFEEYIKKSNILGQVIGYQAKHSPNSVITGMGGAIPTIGAADFAAGFDTASKIGSTRDSSTGNNNLIGIGMSYGSYNQRNAEDVKSLTLPLSYTIRSDSDPRRQLIISLPISKVTTGDDALSVHAGLGAAVRFPITDNWTLTPGAKYSVVASKDRATVATIMSGSLMSTYTIPMGAYHLGIGNMVGVYKTGKFTSGEYSFDPGVNLKMTRNGLLLSMPTSFASGLATEVSVIDTRYLGDAKPYVASTQEVGVTFGTNKNAANAKSFTRVGLSYVRGKDTKGFSGNIGYWF